MELSLGHGAPCVISLEWNQHELDQLLRHFISVSSYYLGLFLKISPVRIAPPFAGLAKNNFWPH